MPTSYPTLKLLTEAPKSRFHRGGRKVQAVDPAAVLKMITDQCDDWLAYVGGIQNALNSDCVWRGIDKEVSASVITVAIRSNRRPRDQDPSVHREMNNMINKAGLLANRSNSIFVTGDYEMASEYALSGTPHAVFPVGECYYTWAENVQDPMVDFDHGTVSPSEVIYKGDDGSIRTAIKSGHEIMITAASAILVHPDMVEKLRKALRAKK